MSPNPYAAPETRSTELEPAPQSQGEGWVSTYRQSALIVVFVAAFAEGFVSGAMPTGQLLTVMTLASAITLWCGLDARVHGKVLLRSFAWTLMFTWPIGVGVHLVWTRGARGILSYFVATVACFGAAAAGAGVAALFALR